MAEGILSDVVGRILEVLGSQALREIQLACGVKDEILKLKDTVETISGVLLDAEEQFNQKKGKAVKVWLRRLKDAVYDADDLLDDFCTQLKLNEMTSGSKMAKEVRIFFSKSNQIAYSLKMGHKIKAIRERLDDIKNDKQFLLFKHDNGKGVNYYNRSEREQTHSFECEENVIGRDDDKNAVLQLLLDSNDHADHNISVVSIVGIGGVGKTALAQSIYNVEKVKTHFQISMWVCVSDDFSLKTVVEMILKSAMEKEIEKLEMDGLQKKLREQINGHKYFLVLDDVWNENLDKWLKLKTLLKNGATGSKILVTTRSERVANIMSKAPLIYVLRGLIEDKSWSLFTKIAFEQGEEPKDSRLVGIGKDIVAKCAGVPLAIRTIGRLLYCKNKEEDWLTFRDQELSEIDQEEGDILPILKLSYYHLSPQLKQCFAYCALFPKDYEFEKENLIQLWMAQGFLSTSKKNQHLEDIGNVHFIDLLSRSFFQDLKEQRCWGERVVTCKMHDLMHDLAQSVIGSECQMIKSDGDNVDGRSRHISFAPNLESLKMSTAMLQTSRLRTFLPMSKSTKLDFFHFSKFISSFKCLHTLNLGSSNIEKIPTSIGKLKHLRYLDLSRNGDLKELPDSMWKLINLQTLNLNGCRSLQKLPRDMRKMVSLQYLMIYNCDSLTSMPHGLGQLTGLRILSWFAVGKRDRKNDALRELNGLNELRGSLRIKILGDEENVNLAEVNLEEKQYLESLWLVGKSDYGRMTVEGLKPHSNLKELSVYGLGNVMFSGCMSSFTHLSEIEIANGESFQNITPLGRLPSLLLLTLMYLPNLEYLSASDRVGDSSTSTAPPTAFFPSLKELVISDCKKLKGWWKINDDQVTTTTTEEEEEKAEVLLSFPRLSRLSIGSCPELTCMPLYPTLEVLNFRGSNTKTLQQTMKMEMKMQSNADVDAAGPSTSYSAFSDPPLSNLKSLNLTSVNDFESLPELLQRVNSLVEMDIRGSPRLNSQLPQCIRYLSSLEKLIIGGCDQLDLQFVDDDCQWQGLRSLRYLLFLEVENMERLPKWINHITTLQHLQIWLCNSLMCLPEGMQLDKLEIWVCPHLSKRCGNKKGVEWPKIAHIPNIQIDFVWIQLEGHYQAKEAARLLQWQMKVCTKTNK
ncbi:NBS-LRR disease resistance protein [Melia azedarach]|uniref:NBS-LRR disease resistance protein n=1 Tax=Melia azedarach TaxID=155640 RepID=A0ACC1XVQ8_MELAZ|nr:NBS-LRR disease resistance protein [Melia azedarach]